MWFCRRKRGEAESKKSGGRVEKGGMLQTDNPILHGKWSGRGL